MIVKNELDRQTVIVRNLCCKNIPEDRDLALYIGSWTGSHMMRYAREE